MRKLIIATVVALALATAAPAGAQIRLQSGRHEFYFHGNLGSYAGKSVTEFGATIEVWDWDASGTASATKVISVALPAGACASQGTWCSFSDPAVTAKTGGIRNFKMSYRSGKIWMQSFGDVSAAVNPKMMVNVIIGSDTYSITAVFTKTKQGWLLPDNDPQW